MGSAETLDILIVDDSPVMRGLVRAALVGGGYSNLREAEDGQIALEMVQEQLPDIIITDLNMPNMDGLELVEALRGREECAGLPIIMLTTEGGDGKRTSGRQAGVTGWLTKPCDPATLVKAVRRLTP